MKLKHCRDCKWSIQLAHMMDGWLKCSHPRVNCTKSDYLVSGKRDDLTSAAMERGLTWFAACGAGGKLWEVASND